MIFITRVSGIPCQCKVDYTPPDINSFEFKLLDRKGYHAPWLERKVDAVVIDNLFTQYFEELGSA